MKNPLFDDNANNENDSLLIDNNSATSYSNKINEIVDIKLEIARLFKLGKNPDSNWVPIDNLFNKQITLLKKNLAPCDENKLADELLSIKTHDAVGAQAYTLLSYAAHHGIYAEYEIDNQPANQSGVNAAVFSTLMTLLKNNLNAQKEMQALLTMPNKPAMLQGQIESQFKSCTKNLTPSITPPSSPSKYIPLKSSTTPTHHYDWKNSWTLRCAGTVGFVTFGALAIMAILGSTGSHSAIEDATKTLADLFNVNNSPLGISSPGAPQNKSGNEFKFLSFTAGMFTTAAAIVGACADGVKQYRKNR